MILTVQSFQLPSGYDMPLISLGTFKVRGKTLVEEVLDYALSAGYRSIDTAAIYGNEEDIGMALKRLLPKYRLSRTDIFITSKLSPALKDQGDEARRAIRASIRKLQCDYLDLYLIHWPGFLGVPSNSPDNIQLRAESWEALKRAQEIGLVRDIGVSNFMVNHLTALLKDCAGVKPAVNQVEWHPGCNPVELQAFCRKENILLQAYSTLGGTGTGNPSLLQEPNVVKVANKLNKSPAQILYRWVTQQKIGIVPKARSREHIRENINLDFDIPIKDMISINDVDMQRYAWNPDTILF